MAGMVAAVPERQIKIAYDSLGGMSITRKLAAVLAIGALVTPAAAVAHPLDIHAGLVQEQTQDLRSPDARDAAEHRRADVGQPMGATVLDSASMRPAPGQPTWPASAEPLPPAPAASVPDDGFRVEWPTVAVGIAGSLLVLAGLGVAISRRRTQRLRVAA
jgi:hypothetical protein